MPIYPQNNKTLQELEGLYVANVVKGAAIKHDQGKVRWDLVPWDATEEIVKVLTFGANKYQDRNWEKGFNWTRLTGSLMRHVVLWLKGEDNDPESGLSHLAHAGCNILFLLTFVLRGVGADDRVKMTK